MAQRKNKAKVKYVTPVTTPPDQDVKTSLVSYTGGVVLYETYVHLIDEQQYVPWDKIFSVIEA